MRSFPGAHFFEVEMLSFFGSPFVFRTDLHNKIPIEGGFGGLRVTAYPQPGDAHGDDGQHMQRKKAEIEPEQQYAMPADHLRAAAQKGSRRQSGKVQEQIRAQRIVDPKEKGCAGAGCEQKQENSPVP